jgi:3-hydroxyisobutyrate dehydrogenase-like beta-hydroxyacid dehydrogenase
MATVTSSATRVPDLRLGWVGLGSMGNAMAKKIHSHLIAHKGQPLRFFNRTASRGDSLESIGGVRCHSVAQVANESDVVFISVRWRVVISPFEATCH